MRYALAVLTLLCSAAVAQTIYEVRSTDGIIVTLYEQPCSLADQVTNLPWKATWTEKGKTSEGCFAIRPDLGVVVLYFGSDKTVSVIPVALFTKGTQT